MNFPRVSGNSAMDESDCLAKSIFHRNVRVQPRTTPNGTVGLFSSDAVGSFILSTRSRKIVSLNKSRVAVLIKRNLCSKTLSRIGSSNYLGDGNSCLCRF